MVDSVQYSADEAVHITHCQTDCNVTDLCHRGICQHAAEVILSHCHNRTDKNTCYTENAQNVERTLNYRVINLEDIIYKTNYSICRSLTHAACNKSSSARMSEGVGIRLPAMQREQCHLDTEADDKAGYGNRKQRRIQMRHYACGKVRHIQCTCHSVQITDTKQIQRSTDGTD